MYNNYKCIIYNKIIYIFILKWSVRNNNKKNVPKHFL